MTPKRAFGPVPVTENAAVTFNLSTRGELAERWSPTRPERLTEPEAARYWLAANEARAALQPAEVVTLDPASCDLANHAVQAARHFTERDDGLVWPCVAQPALWPCRRPQPGPSWHRACG